MYFFDCHNGKRFYVEYPATYPEENVSARPFERSMPE